MHISAQQRALAKEESGLVSPVLPASPWCGRVELVCWVWKAGTCLENFSEIGLETRAWRWDV